MASTRLDSRTVRSELCSSTTSRSVMSWWSLALKESIFSAEIDSGEMRISGFFPSVVHLAVIPLPSSWTDRSSPGRKYLHEIEKMFYRVTILLGNNLPST